MLRVNMGSTDPEKSLEPGRPSHNHLSTVRDEPRCRSASRIGDEDVAMSTGSRTPAAQSTGGGTPVQQSSSTPKHSSQWEGWRSKPGDAASETAENTGWSTGESTLNGSAAGDEKTAEVEWGSGGSTTDQMWLAAASASNDGWGPAAAVVTSEPVEEQVDEVDLE